MNKLAIKAYSLLTKPGIILGNLITTAAGFALASNGGFDGLKFLSTMLGLILIIASACTFNNIIDRHSDQKMKRTKNRPLAQGTISIKAATIFAVALGLLGTYVFLTLVNLASCLFALFGFFVYVILYSFSKHRSVHGTLIGSFAGAAPPVIGYLGAGGRFDAGALILFALIAAWQMPHFFAIALFRKEDYAAASIPVLPLKKGIKATKIQMLIFISAFIAIVPLLTFAHYRGPFYLFTAEMLGVAWLGLGIAGFKAKNDSLWARQMFFFSLVVVLGLSLAIALPY